MPFDSNKWTDKSVVSYEEMLQRVQTEFPSLVALPSENNAVAKLWQVPGFKGSLGFITAMTDEFCSSCNRLRLTSDGKIKACLFGEEEVNLLHSVRNGASEQELVELIRSAVWSKKEKLGGYASPLDISHGTNRPMIKIGG
jgi:cyclic pyranopterin phosphate synthase